jgi:hypothetical protein
MDGLDTLTDSGLKVHFRGGFLSWKNRASEFTAKSSRFGSEFIFFLKSWCGYYFHFNTPHLINRHHYEYSRLLETHERVARVAG